MSNPSKEKSHDVVLLHSPTDDGNGLRALRSRPGRVELAEIRPLKEGKPLDTAAEVVSLHPRKESPLLWDVAVQYSPRQASSSEHSGPPRFTTGQYRGNWEAVFGKKGTSATDKRTLN